MRLSKGAHRVHGVKEMQKRGQDVVNRVPGSKDTRVYVSKFDYNPNPNPNRNPNLDEYSKMKRRTRDLPKNHVDFIILTHDLHKNMVNFVFENFDSNPILNPTPNPNPNPNPNPKGYSK
jgi:hypothetical protein